MVRYGSDRVFHVSDPMHPGLVSALRSLQETLPCRSKSAPVQEIGPALPRVLGEGDRRAEVRGLSDRVPCQGQMVAHPFRLPGVGGLRRTHEFSEYVIVHRRTMEQRLAGPLEETAGGRRLRVRGIARFKESLRRENRIRPRGASELFRRALRDARRLLGGGEGSLEPTFLEPPPGLDEQVLDPVEVDGGIVS